MTEFLNRYRRNADAFADTIRAVPDDAWASPSPCPGWDARAVVGHVVSTLDIFEKLVGREQRPGPSVEDDPLGAFQAMRAQVEEELADPALADIEYEGFFGRMSFAASVDQFLSGDLVVHRWDLAKATG